MARDLDIKNSTYIESEGELFDCLINISGLAVHIACEILVGNAQDMLIRKCQVDRLLCEM